MMAVYQYEFTRIVKMYLQCKKPTLYQEPSAFCIGSMWRIYDDVGIIFWNKLFSC